MMKNILKVCVIATIGAMIFSLFKAPIPWLLGPIFSLLACQFLYKGSLHWPENLRNIGLVILGLVIGQQFNLALFQHLGTLLVYMFLMNVALIGSSVGLSYVLSKWSKLSFKSMILGTIPGGIAQIIVFAEEEKDTDLAAITYFHMTRLLLVVIIVPFIVTGDVTTEIEPSFHITFGLIGFILITWFFSVLAKRIHMPVAEFITAILIAIGFSFTPFPFPEMPSYLMNFALLCIGSHIGLALKPHMIQLPTRYLLAGVFGAVALLALTYGMSFILVSVLDFSFATSFLSTAPGGLDQMVLLADASGADVSTVTVFQIFRLLFIFLMVMPMLRFYYKKIAKNKSSEQTIEEAQ